MSTILRARHDGDLETLAAIVSAPRELDIADDFDSRMTDAMVDQLLDSVDPKLRGAIDSTSFACMRLRVAMQSAEAAIRRATNTAESIADRLRRAG